MKYVVVQTEARQVNWLWMSLKKTNNKTQTDAYEVIILRQENNN